MPDQQILSSGKESSSDFLCDEDDAGGSTVCFVENPNDNDVLFGRGAPFNHWKGNIRFRQVVDTWKGTYLATRLHAEKNSIACKVVDEIRIHRSGRFLIKHPNGNRGEDDSSTAWVVAGEDLVREKVKQTLRDRQPGAGSEQQKKEGPEVKKRKASSGPEHPHGFSRRPRIEQVRNEYPQADGPVRRTSRKSWSMPQSARTNLCDVTADFSSVVSSHPQHQMVGMDHFAAAQRTEPIRQPTLDHHEVSAFPSNQDMIDQLRRQLQQQVAPHVVLMENAVECGRLGTPLHAGTGLFSAQYGMHGSLFPAYHERMRRANATEILQSASSVLGERARMIHDEIILQARVRQILRQPHSTIYDTSTLMKFLSGSTTQSDVVSNSLQALHPLYSLQAPLLPVSYLSQRPALSSSALTWLLQSLATDHALSEGYQRVSAGPVGLNAVHLLSAKIGNGTSQLLPSNQNDKKGGASPSERRNQG